MLLALDDTDTVRGGCTTHTALQLAGALERAGGALADWGLVDAPRLVRLNPAAPHKTRGNGALVLPIGRRAADAPTRIIGHMDGTDIRIGHTTGYVAHTDVAEPLMELVARQLPDAAPDGTDPQPGAVLLPHAAHPRLYTQAVSRLVRPADAWHAAPPRTIRLTGTARRGEIGALAAAAWPRHTWTWEHIAYRPINETDTTRDLPDAFIEAVHALAGGFDNHDTTTGRMRAVPRTPCPVRWGLRGRDPEALLALHHTLAPTDHWLVQTNHATGDHARWAGPTPIAHGIVRGAFQVTAQPRRGAGGHMTVTADDADGRASTLAAFEPTKTLRDTLGVARPGDRLVVLGRSGADPRVVAVEAFRFQGAPVRRHKVANPRCGSCGRAMKSIGASAGYRCRPCGTHAAVTAATWLSRPGPSTRYVHQVPDHVRGHLLPPPGGLGPCRTLDGKPGPAIPALLLEATHQPAAWTTGHASDRPSARPPTGRAT